MYKLLTNSWTLLCVWILGVALLMVSARPELQSKPDHEGPAKTVAVAGHVLAWTSGTVLVYRMVQNAREQKANEAAGAEPSEPTADA